MALQIGHRKSIDLDLFGEMEPDEVSISAAIKPLGEIVLLKKTPNIFIYSINGIKVDFVNYHYPWLTPMYEVEGIRFARKEDIAAMKISAITGRGTKKDFIDLFYLLKDFSMKKILSFYNEKYYDGSEFLALKSLI